MPDIHDQATQWAQANPKDPRAQDIMAKAWASQNPQDPRSSQILSKLGQPSSYVKLPQDTGYTPGGTPASAALADPTGNLRNAKIGTGLALGGLAGAESAGAGLTSRAGVNAGAAGLQKYLSNIMDKSPDASQGVLPAAALGGGLSAGGDILASGLKGAANSSMLRAVGLTGAKSKNVPSDLGNRMVDEGLWGTKSGMADQVAEKYADAESHIQDLASELKGNVDSKTIAQAVGQSAKQHLNPETGLPISGGEEAVSAKQTIADNIEKGGAGYSPGTTSQTNDTTMMDSDGTPITLRSDTTAGTPSTPGSYGGQALMKLKRQGDSEAFNQSGLVGNTHKADAYKAQADAARQSLSDLSDGAMPAALKREQTLLYANKGLMQPTMVQKNPVSLTDIGSAMVGGGSHGLPGAGTAVLASKAAMSPLVQSLFAKGAQAGSNATSAITDPAVLQSLFGISNAANTNGN